MDNSASQKQARKRGPKPKLNRAQMEAVRIAHRESSESVDEIAVRFHVTKQTIYNVLRRLQKEQQSGEAA